MKHANYDHGFGLLIEFKTCLRVAKPNAFATSGRLKSVGFRECAQPNLQRLAKAFRK